MESPPSLNAIRDAVRQVIREELHAAQAPLDTKQTARRLNVSVRKLDELVAGGELRPLRIGRKRLFPQEQLDGFLRSKGSGRFR